MDHEPMVAAAPSARRTMPVSSSTARSRSSFTITWSNSSACASCSRARARRSPISPSLSVARSRRRRSSSSKLGARTKIVTAPGTVSRTTVAQAKPARPGNGTASGASPAPEVPVITMTGLLLPVEEANQLRALTVGQPAHGLRLADPARVQEAGRLHAPELGDGHEYVDHLRGLDVVRRFVEYRLDLDASVLEVLLEPRAPHPAVVRSLERVHSLVERANRRLSLGLLRHH